VRALSSFKEEPEWLAEKRLSAWRAFEALPMPTLRDEAWRYTDISDVRIEDFLPYAPSPDAESEGDLPEAVQKLIEEGEENSPCSSSTTPRRLTAAWTTRLAPRASSLRTCTRRCGSTRRS
jgi:Fe-S cluster assembly scaffold protein SufB